MPHDIRTQVLSAIDAAIASVGATKAEQGRYAAPLKHARAIIEEIPPYRPCRLCLDFVPPNGKTGSHSVTFQEFCMQWKAPIPPEWMDVGCDNWLDDIPF